MWDIQRLYSSIVKGGRTKVGSVEQISSKLSNSFEVVVLNMDVGVGVGVGVGANSVAWKPVE
ncbi:hypothetical protein PG990_005911 [Apiospora arundinis]|uniref:Uncharacterized protein n=1 Tax=Apiospora arundinis TaxID=335852 RepID=A0ABR2J9V2_9PEZI